MPFIEVTLKSTGKKLMVGVGGILAVVEMPKPSGPFIRVREIGDAFEVVEDYVMVRAMIRDITDAKVTHDFTQQQGTAPSYTWKPEHD